MKTVVVGTGWSGCAASLAASKQGAEVLLVERTDMLLGTGLVGGIMRNNGRFTAAEEMIALRVIGVENLFCAGEKAGLLVGHTEAVVTGTVAGYNAARNIKREKPFILPTILAVGDAITYVRTQMETKEKLG